MKMNWETFFKEIKANRIAGLYLFTGPEARVRESAQDALRAQLLPPGLEEMNESILESPQTQTLIDACETLPFMGEKRLVVARDYPPLLPGKIKDEENEAEQLAGWLPTLPETCCLVFSMRNGADGKKKAARLIEKLGTVVAFEPLDDAHLMKWLEDEAKKRHTTIAPAVCRQLVFLAGRSLTRLSGEMEKLAAYAGGGPITKEAVEASVTPSPEARVFDMIDAITAGQSARALVLFKTLLDAGENPFGILALLTRQTRLMTHLRLGLDQGTPLPVLKERLGLSAFVADKMLPATRRIPADTLEAAYRACVDTDYNIKSGRAREDEALSRLLIGLCDMAGGGKCAWNTGT